MFPCNQNQYQYFMKPKCFYILFLAKARPYLYLIRFNYISFYLNGLCYLAELCISVKCVYTFFHIPVVAPVRLFQQRTYFSSELRSGF